MNSNLSLIMLVPISYEPIALPIGSPHIFDHPPTKPIEVRSMEDERHNIDH